MIEISLFGATTVACGIFRWTATDLGGNKQRQILEMLAMDVGAPVSKELLAERLWDGRPPRAYIPTLESHVCCLRRRLAGLAGDRDSLVTTVGGYLLDEERVRVDVVEVRALLDSNDVTKVQHTLDLVHGVLLADDPYAAWADQARLDFAARSAQRYVEAAHRANGTGDHELAATFARAAAGADRYWSEPAVQELMRALAASGNRASALLEYQALRTLLAEELGIDPSPATQEVFMSILSGAPSQGSDDVGILLGLLKRALAADGCRRTSDGPAMVEVGQMLLARA